LFAETIPPPEAPTLSASTAAPAIFKEGDLGDRSLALQFF
jgi:hypothetical protein